MDNFLSDAKFNVGMTKNRMHFVIGPQRLLNVYQFRVHF